MGGCARPCVLFWPRYQICPNGIALDVAEGNPKVRIVEWARIKPVLPKVPRTSPACVQVQRISAVCATECNRQRARLLRDRDQVDMVVHQAVSKNPSPCLRRIGRKPFEVRAAIPVREKDTLVVDAALSNMVCYSDRNGAREPRHMLEECHCTGDFSLRTISLRPGSSGSSEVPGSSRKFSTLQSTCK